MDDDGYGPVRSVVYMSFFKQSVLVLSPAVMAYWIERSPRIR